MAGSAILRIDVLADATKAVAGLNSVGTAATKQTKTVTTFGTKSTAAFKGVTSSVASMALGGLGAATAIVGLGHALVDASKAAMEDEKSQALLAKSMENNLDATDNQVASMEDFIDKTARASGVADDQLRPALNHLIIAGQDAATAQDTLGVAMDIAAAKGLDVETVAKALAKAYDGNVAGLARLGIETKDASGETVDFDTALQNAAETMGGSAAEAAGTLEGQMRRYKIAVDEAKESVGGFINEALAKTISELEFLDATMAGATKGNELFAIGIRGTRGQLKKGQGDVENLAAALIFAAEHGVAPTTKEFKKQAKQMNLNLGETRDLTDTLGWLASEGHITRESAYALMTMLNQQGDAMETTREDGRLLYERYGDLAESAETAEEKARDYRVELGRQAAKMKELTDPVYALRQAQRRYNAAFETWSDLAVTGTANAEDLAVAEDDLTIAGVDLAVAERDVEKSAGKMEDSWNDARAAVGLLEDQTLQSKDAIDQWSDAVNNAPRWHPGTGSGAGPTPLQAGGPVFAGAAYTVGEAGRELFLPGISGLIVPHGQTEQMLKRSPGGGGGAGGGSYTLNMHVKRADPQDVAWGFRRLELLRTGR